MRYEDIRISTKRDPLATLINKLYGLYYR